MKPIICKHCGAINQHHSFQCSTQKKPIKSKVVSSDIKPVEKKKIYRIPNVSENMKERLKEYRFVRDEYMKANVMCQYEGCNRKSEDLHHKASRKYHLCNVSIFMAVCRIHHTHIHDNAEESYQKGYLIKSI